MSIPLYEKIRTDIEKQILSGELSPGDQIPIESELMRVYGCARMTVSKAIATLAAEGFVERRKRGGTIVAKPRLHSMILDVPNLVNEIEARGQVHRWQLLLRRVRKPARTDRLEQALARGGKLLELRGVHFSDEEPLAVEHRLVSLLSVPAMADITLDEESPGDWLIRQVPWTEAETRIAAVGAETDIAERLGIPEGFPCLSIERGTWRGATPITRVRQIFQGAKYDLFARFGHEDSRRRDSR